MFRSTCIIVVALSFVAGCGSNKKLSQESAESTIKTFATEHPAQFSGGGDGCSLAPQSIASIAPVSQFSETEATTAVTLRCTGGNVLRLNFVFQKDVDAKWFLTQVSQLPGDHQYQVDSDLLQRIGSNLRIAAQ
jgi:hypothetical protein